jgi:hypothetical protein
VWVDALAQARLLTGMQAAEINAGRGERLELGPYVLQRSLSLTGLGACFLARHRQQGNLARVLVLPRSPNAPERLQRLERLLDASRLVESEFLAPIHEVGVQDERLWAACRYDEGPSAAEWMVAHGRFPPQVVLQLARQMLAALLELERFELVHGDLSARGLVLRRTGQVSLGMPGVRGIVRPSEGYAHGDLAPAAYDYLAPERVEQGAGPTTLSDVYACGAVWWHLLAGRPPFPGGNSLAKLRAVHEARLPDLSALVPDAPRPLLQAIARCMSRDLQQRPQQFAELAELLGPVEASSNRVVALFLAEEKSTSFRPRGRRVGRRARAVGRIAAVLMALAAGGVFWWQSGRQINVAASANSVNPPRTLSPPPAKRLDPPVVATAGAAQQRRGPIVKTSGVAASRDLLLPTGRVLHLEALRLRDGQTVRGQKGRRPQVVVPAKGIAIDAERATLENIDFFWDGGSGRAEVADRALLQLNAARVELRGCSFQSLRPSEPMPVAVIWTGPRRPARRGQDAGDLVIADCAFGNVAAAIDACLSGSATIEVSGTLHVSAGPLVRLASWPPQGSELVLLLSRVTSRESGAVLACANAGAGEAAGTATIAADQCVLAPVDGTALIEVESAEPPAGLVQSVRWSGQGTLIAEAAPLVIWQDANGQRRSLDETELDVGGLVRSPLEFAGPAEKGPAASRLVRWQGPLRSSEPPGALAGGVFLPKKPLP